MRFAALILGIAGGVLALMFCVYWLGDAQEAQQYAQSQGALGQMALQAVADKLAQRATAGWLMLPAGLVGIAGGVLAFRGKGRLAGTLMLAAGVAPAFFYPPSLVTTSLLLLGGMFAFFAKPKPAVALQPARA